MFTDRMAKFNSNFNINGASSFLDRCFRYLIFSKCGDDEPILSVCGQPLARWMLLGLILLPSLTAAEDFPRPSRIYTVETTGVIELIDIDER